jgi:hypothetical protein
MTSPANIEDDIRKEVILLPCDYYLSPTGISYFVKKNIPMRDLQSPEYGRVTGVNWKSCKRTFLTHAMLFELFRGVAVKQLEFYSKKKEIMKLLETMVLSAIQIRLPQKVKAALQALPDAARLFEQLPLFGFSVQAQRTQRTEAIRQEILTTLLQRFYDLLALEPSVDWYSQGYLDQFIQRISLDSLLVLSMLKNEKGFSHALTACAEVVLASMKQTAVAEAMGLFGLEYLQRAEQSHFLYLAERDRFARTNKHRLKDLLADESFRTRIAQQAIGKEEFISLYCGMPMQNRTQIQTPEIHMIMRNRGLFEQDERVLALDKTAEGTYRISLDTLAQRQSNHELEVNLLLLYYQSLQELCQKNSLNLTATLEQDRRTKETKSTLILGFL